MRKAIAKYLKAKSYRAFLNKRDLTKPKEKVNTTYFRIKIILGIVLGIIGFFALSRMILYFSTLLNIMTDLIKTSEMTPEFKLIVVCIGIYLNYLFITLVLNFIFKIFNLIPPKYDLIE